MNEPDAPRARRPRLWPAARSRQTESTAAIPTRQVDLHGVAAPVTGELIALGDVADPAFSSGALGPGVGIRPTSNDITAPVTGTVLSVMPHAYGLRSTDGIEVLVHIGVDTVELEGRGFTAHVSQGQHVSAGAPLAQADLTTIADAGYDTTVIVVVTNARQLGDVTPRRPGPVEAGTPAITI